MTDRDDELAETLDELTETIAELRAELETVRERRRQRLRPPTPGELLQLADEVAIPTLVAVLEANLRALEAFQRGIQLVRTDREVRDRSDAVADATRSRAEELRRTTLDGLDTALVELQRAVGEGALPRDRRARELIEEARELREEVDDRLRDAGSEAVEIDVADGRRDEETAGSDDAAGDGEDAAGDVTAGDDAADEPSVDVDAELDTLRDRYAPEDDDRSDADD